MIPADSNDSIWSAGSTSSSADVNPRSHNSRNVSSSVMMVFTCPTEAIVNNRELPSTMPPLTPVSVMVKFAS